MYNREGIPLQETGVLPDKAPGLLERNLGWTTGTILRANKHLPLTETTKRYPEPDSAD